MLRARLFFSFRSPYSYLAVGRYRHLAATHELSLTLCPVYPLAIRNPEFFANQRPEAMAYVLRDVQRVADFLELPFRWPDPDPVVQDLGTRAIAPEQPYIHQITRLGQVAARHRRGLDFAAEAAALIWGGTRNWHRGTHLREAMERSGLDPDMCEKECARDADAIDAEIAANQAALAEAGHWGAPVLVFEGEPFFGQDRFEHAVWRMKQKGLKSL